METMDVRKLAEMGAEALREMANALDEVSKSEDVGPERISQIVGDALDASESYKQGLRRMRLAAHVGATFCHDGERAEQTAVRVDFPALEMDDGTRWTLRELREAGWKLAPNGA